MTLLRLKAQCPKCHRPPNVRISQEAARKHKFDDPDAVVGTVQCTGCGEVYLLTARSYQEAAA